MFKAELIDYINAYGNAYAFIQLGGLQKNYGDILISGGVVSDIPASGGETQVTGYTYSQTYGYGDSTTNGGTITSGADIEVTSVSADSLGTTEKERTKLGESVLTVTMNGKSATSSYEVYQQANVKSVSGTSGGAYSYGNVSAGSITNATIGAGGGSATAYAGNGSQSWSRTAITTNYSYTSGATSSAVTTAAQSGTNSIAPSASSYTASANSKGTSVSGVTTVGSKYITWSANGKSTGGTMYVYQAANEITSRSFIDKNNIGAYCYATIELLSGYNISLSGFAISLPYRYSGSARITITNLINATFSSGASGQINEAPNRGVSFNNLDALGASVSGSWNVYTVNFTSLSASHYQTSLVSCSMSYGGVTAISQVIVNCRRGS